MGKSHTENVRWSPETLALLNAYEAGWKIANGIKGPDGKIRVPGTKGPGSRSLRDRVIRDLVEDANRRRAQPRLPSVPREKAKEERVAKGKEIMTPIATKTGEAYLGHPDLGKNATVTRVGVVVERVVDGKTIRSVQHALDLPLSWELPRRRKELGPVSGKL